MIIAEPVETRVVPAGAQRITAEDAPRVVEMVAQPEIAPPRPRRMELVEYYLGDTTPGMATRRFIEDCERVMEIRDRAWVEPVARGPGGP